MARPTKEAVLKYLTNEIDVEAKNDFEIKPDDDLVKFMTAW